MHDGGPAVVICHIADKRLINLNSMQCSMQDVPQKQQAPLGSGFRRRVDDFRALLEADGRAGPQEEKPHDKRGGKEK